jgi:thiamine biosynthesis lipoprotein
VRGEHGDSILLLHDAAMATSGPSSQSIRDAAGHEQSHVIDPSTGTGLDNGVEVTVMAHHGAVADAVATALTILPRSKWGEILRRFDVELVAVVKGKG